MKEFRDLVVLVSQLFLAFLGLCLIVTIIRVGLEVVDKLIYDL